MGRQQLCRASAAAAALLFCATYAYRRCEPPSEASSTSPFCAGTPPRVAWCVAGGARTLAEPIVHQSIRRNLIDAFGACVLHPRPHGRPCPAPAPCPLPLTELCPAPSRSTVFALLKTTDNADKLSWGVAPRNSSEAELQAALGVLGVEASRTMFLPSAADPQPNPRCRLQPEWMGAAGKRMKVKTWLNSHLPGTLGQIGSWSRCLEMVEQAEAATGERFDLVAKVRPDTYWFQAVLPWCSFQQGAAYWGDFLNKSGGASAIVRYPHDQFFLLPRPLAPAIFTGMLRSYQDCQSSLKVGHSLEEWAWDTVTKAARQLGTAVLRYPFPQVILRPTDDAADIENKCARFVVPALPPAAGDSEQARIRRCVDLLYHNRS